MADHITVKPASGTWVIRAAGAVIGESNSALELTEGDYPSVIYFPRADVATAFLDKTEKSTHCPWKGDATYYSIEGNSGTLDNAAWSYESPLEGMEEIRDHLAFFTDRVTVEQL